VKNEKKVETLKELGLTTTEAKIYLTLIQKGPITAKEIAQISKIARPDVYRIISNLQKEGAIETLIAKPTIFEAVPAKNLVPSLLKRQIVKQEALYEKTEKLLSDLKRNPSSEIHREPSVDYTIVPGKEVIVQKLKQAVLDAEISVCTVTSKNRFSAAMLEFADAYEAALEKGVRIRLAVERHVPQKAAIKIAQTLMKDQNFEVKYFEGPPAAIVSIFDSKIALVTMSATAQLAGTSALWSSSSSFVKLAETYFEKRWDNANLIKF
jgi:sugar-specific transcriptional regulator TrmB